MLNEDLLYGILLALICWGGWFLALGKIVNAFFGNTRFVLDKNGLETTWTCLSFKQEKRISIGKICRFDCHRKVMGLHGKAARWHRWLYVVCDNNKVSFLTPAGFLTQSSKELDDLCNQLNAFLKTLKQTGER